MLIASEELKAAVLIDYKIHSFDRRIEHENLSSWKLIQGRERISSIVFIAQRR